MDFNKEEFEQWLTDVSNNAKKYKDQFIESEHRIYLDKNSEFEFRLTVIDDVANTLIDLTKEED